MRNILALIQRFYVTLLFLALLTVGGFMLFSSNNYHRSAFVEHSTDLVGEIYNRRDNLSRYLRLGDINDQLSLENARLRSRLPENYLLNDTTTGAQRDTAGVLRYMFRPARVINATVTRDMNYLTLDRGENQGIRKDMGVISGRNVVGIVTSTSPNFSIVMPVIHSNFRTPVRVNGFFGQLTWPGGDPEKARVDDIPKHARIQPGDTVMTTGFGFTFPANQLIGYVDKVDMLSKESFHVISIRLATDYRKLNYVEVISDLMRTEIETLQLKQDSIDGADNR
ncbi:MAG: rod shape-determining protein MreC [Flavobacteriales bacterium]|jgi:rod shape-determining protein MreC